MATTSRPLIEVFQQFDDAPITAESPDQPALVCAPAYHIRDFDEDKSNLSVGEYGSRTAHCNEITGESKERPTSSDVELALQGVPDSPSGSYQLDNSSLRGFMDDVLLEIVAEGSSDGEIVNTGENLFASASNITNFYDAGVRIGDRLVVTDTDGPFTIERTVIEVGGRPDRPSTEANDPATIGDNELLVRTDFPDGTSEEGLKGNTQSSMSTNLAFRVERQVSDREFYDHDDLESWMSDSWVQIAGPDNDSIDVHGGIVLDEDIPVLDAGDPLESNFSVNAAETYFDYRALRKDMAQLKTVQRGNVEDVAGRLDERNPLAIGLNLAFQNAQDIPVRYYGFPADNLNGEEDVATEVQNFVDHISTKDELYSISFLQEGLNNLITVGNHADGFADPDIAKYRAALGGGVELPEFKELIGLTEEGEVSSVTGDTVDIFVSDGADFTNGYDGKEVQERDELVIANTKSQDERNNAAINSEEPYRVSEVLPQKDLLRLEDPTEYDSAMPDLTDPESYYIRRGNEEVVDTFDVDVDPATFGDNIVQRVQSANTDYTGYLIELVGADSDNEVSPLGTSTFLIIDDDTGNTNQYVLGSEVTLDTVETVEARIKKPVFSKIANSVTTRPPYRIFEDTEGTFLSNNVQAGDFVEVPVPAKSASNVTEDDFEDGSYVAEIESALSDNRVRFTDTVDVPTTDSTTPQNDIAYKALRKLDKAGQVDYLKEIPQSVGNRRVVLTWPDEIKLSGIENGRTGRQNWLSGRYAAAAIAGMSASLPPHQGLTNLEVNGIDKIRHSDDYFTFSQISELSNNGWFLLTQENDETPPTIVHQVTTDVSSLPDTEWSLVRTVDYVSSTFKNVLDTFLGEYNVTQSLLDTLAVSIEASIEDLKDETFPKIGAPLISARIETLKQSDTNDDEVELVVDAEFPAPLNRIKLTVKG